MSTLTLKKTKQNKTTKTKTEKNISSCTYSKKIVEINQTITFFWAHARSPSGGTKFWLNDISLIF